MDEDDFFTTPSFSDNQPAAEYQPAAWHTYSLAPAPAFYSNSVTNGSEENDVQQYPTIAAEVMDLRNTLYTHMDFANQKIMSLELENKMLKARVEELHQNMLGKKHRRARTLSICTPKYAAESPTSTYSMSPPKKTPSPTKLMGPPISPSGPYHMLSSLALTSPSPKTPTTPSRRRTSQTFLNKSPINNLYTKLPPSNVKFPELPLSDKELIVFFYNSVVRPVVASRLYARMGPSDITAIINEHRKVEPHGYHKNTCSVKCTTSIRRGQEIVGKTTSSDPTVAKEAGEAWAQELKRFFQEADDVKATDALRMSEEEEKDSVDYRVLDMDRGLKKFPDEDGEMSTFTKRLRWCIANNVDILLSDLHKVDDPDFLSNNALNPHSNYPLSHDNEIHSNTFGSSVFTPATYEFSDDMLMRNYTNQGKDEDNEDNEDEPGE